MSKVKCYSVRLESLISISEKCFKATAFDGSTALIPKSQVFGQDHEVQKSEAWWISAWILDQKDIQYSTKKVSFFDKDRAEYIPETGVEIERYIPEEKECVEVAIVTELIKELTTSDIFKANQVLTLEKAKSLIGKKIACTSPEYKYNTPHMSEFVIKEIISKFEWADRYIDDNAFPQGSQAKYWESYMSEKQLDKVKTQFVIISEDGLAFFMCHSKYDNFYSEPTFTGSDADREVYYVEL